MSKYTGTPTWEHQNDFFTEICQQRIDDTRRSRVQDCAGDIWLPTSEAEFVSKRVYLKGIAGVQILTIWIIIHYKLKVESWQIYLCMPTRACMHRGMCAMHTCMYMWFSGWVDGWVCMCMLHTWRDTVYSAAKTAPFLLLQIQPETKIIIIIVFIDFFTLF